MFIDSFADYFLKNEQNITYRKFQSQFQWPFKDFFIGRENKSDFILGMDFFFVKLNYNTWRECVFL
jgi:hypothetical protein